MALSSVISLDDIKSLFLTQRKTHSDMSNLFKERYPDMRGVPVINVRQFRNENGIRTRKPLNDSEIEKAVTKSIAQVVVRFLQNIVGGKCCYILLYFKVLVWARKVGTAVKKNCPITQTERCIRAGRSFTSKVYKANDFGHKLLVDHNDKLVMYGVTHVVARDGYFGMITGYATIAIKINLTRYEKMFP